MVTICGDNADDLHTILFLRNTRFRIFSVSREDIVTSRRFGGENKTIKSMLTWVGDDCRDLKTNVSLNERIGVTKRRCLQFWAFIYLFIYLYRTEARIFAVFLATFSLL